jgi:hypothetical protein
MLNGHPPLFVWKLCWVLPVLAALTCSAGDEASGATTGPRSCVSSYVPVRDPFSSGVPKLKDLKGVSTRPLALFTSRQAEQGKAQTKWKAIGVTGTLERPLIIVRDLQGNERTVEPKRQVIEVKVPVGDFWYPAEFEGLCKQRCLERNIPMRLPVDEAS